MLILRRAAGSEFLMGIRSRLTLTASFLFLERISGKMLLYSMFESSLMLAVKRSPRLWENLEKKTLGTCFERISGTGAGMRAVVSCLR